MINQITLNNATDIVALFKTTKEQRELFVNTFLEAINEGNISPLDAHLQIKCMNEIATSITDDLVYKKLLLNEVEKHGKSFEYQNAKIEIREVGVKYDYSNCNDPIITDLLIKQIALDNEVKQRQKFLQTLPISGVDVLIEDEVVKVYPPSKSSTTSPVIKLK